MRTTSELVCSCWFLDNICPCLSNKDDIPCNLLGSYLVLVLISAFREACIGANCPSCCTCGWTIETFISGFHSFLGCCSHLSRMVLFQRRPQLETPRICHKQHLEDLKFIHVWLQKRPCLWSIERCVSVWKRTILASMVVFVFVDMQNLSKVRVTVAWPIQLRISVMDATSFYEPETLDIWTPSSVWFGFHLGWQWFTNPLVARTLVLSALLQTIRLEF